MTEIGTIRKPKKMVGIALVITGLILFSVSYNNGLVGQKVYSNQGCAVDSRPDSCTTSNNLIIAGFVGMILFFFSMLGGIALIISGLWTTRKIKGAIS